MLVLFDDKCFFREGCNIFLRHAVMKRDVRSGLSPAERLSFIYFHLGEESDKATFIKEIVYPGYHSSKAI